MRVTTVAILSLLAFVVPGLSRSAIAADNPKPLTEQLEESGLFTPITPVNPAFNSENSRRELFNKPFYEGLQQPQKKEKTLSKGAEGAEVAAVQKRLQAHGFNVGAIDSDFGSRTVAAVIGFQQSKGLKADGVVDKLTWDTLNEEPQAVVEKSQAVVAQQPMVADSRKILAKGAAGSKVKTLQVRLEMQGYDPGPIDGIFGARTMAAVKDFQEAYSLRVDGVVDEATWQALSGK